MLPPHKSKEISSATIVEIPNECFRENGFVIRVPCSLQKQDDRFNPAPDRVKSVSDFAKALGVSLPKVGSYKEQGKVIAVPRREGSEFVYPAWQIHAGKLLPGIDHVIAALDVATPLGKILFFITPAAALDGKRPLDILRKAARMSLTT